MSPDRRRNDRTATWVEASCHVGGRACRARIGDVSNDGCRAMIAVKGVVPGDRVILKLTDLLVLPATVVWIADGQTGLEFGNPMLGAMLNQFMLRFGTRERMH